MLLGVKATTSNQQNLVFTTKFFKEVNSIKSFIHKLEPDVKQFVEDLRSRIIFALKKNASIQQKVVKHRSFSCSDNYPMALSENKKTQACGARGCETCPLLFDLDEDIFVNGLKVMLDKRLNCKSKNIIYLAQCSVCQAKNKRWN